MNIYKRFSALAALACSVAACGETHFSYSGALFNGGGTYFASAKDLGLARYFAGSYCFTDGRCFNGRGERTEYFVMATDQRGREVFQACERRLDYKYLEFNCRYM